MARTTSPRIARATARSLTVQACPSADGRGSIPIAVADVTASPIARLVGARSLNTFGRAVLSATVLWELYARTGSTLVLAAVGAVQVLPVVLLFVPVGALVDRSDRRSLTTAAAALAGVVGLALA